MVRERGPLKGITIVDLSWHLAGPYGTMILADLGARVIKVEQPGSTGGFEPSEPDELDGRYQSLNRNKESVTLDLKTDDGRRLFLELVRHADVVLNNFRPGTMDDLGV